MGWCFGWQNRKSLVNHLTSDMLRTHADGGGTAFVTLAKCFIGNVKYKGTLWAVQQCACQQGPHAEWKLGSPFIVAYLLEYGGRNHEWGYKDVCESMGPYETNCPLSYLAMAPVESPEWRERVRACAENSRLLRRARRKCREAHRRTT